MSYLFSAYGISINHPDNWKIHINPNKTFTANNGVMKIEQLSSDLAEQASLTITWEHAKSPQNDFVKRYMDSIDHSFKKTVKREKRYALISKTTRSHEGHEACIIHSALNANTHIVRPLGKNVALELLQIALYCEHTQRIVVASMTASREYFEDHKEELETILLSLKCHTDTVVAEKVS